MLFGGYEATADAMTSCMWMLSEHPEVQEKLRADPVGKPKMHVEATTRFQNLSMRIDPLD